ncbi:HalOD1 output domain-containing protein [Halosimplex amylolyticum]|uniref:HalOD1 output domain-containing protein n=1 Tax=Halosimplex amylolyticum TaxID=3396616 RepID=UPI003F5678E8
MNDLRGRPTERILAAVAETEGTDPATMEPPLGDVVDPDALHDLLTQESSPTGEPIEVQFSYRGHDIVADASGDIDVR